VARLMKDGGDTEMVQYYNNLFTQYMGQIASMARVLPMFTE
jgi:hypothetical protein